MMSNSIYFKLSTFRKLNLMVSIILFLTVMSACKAKKNVISSSNNIISTKEISKTDLTAIIAHETQFSTFATKAATSFNLNGKQYDLTLNIRIKKGEAIWISVTAIAGLEVARVIFTPDSVKILDRLNEQYINKSFNFVRSFTNKQIDYQTLEALLVGNCPPFALIDSNAFFVGNESNYLKGKQQNLSYVLQFNKQFKTSDFSLSDNIGENNLVVTTPVFEEISNHLLPINLNIDAFAVKQQLKASMHYHKTELNIPLEFPFNVPKRFSEID